MTLTRSDRLTLTLRDASPIPLELDGVTPDRVSSLTPLGVAKLPVFHGNRKEEIGQFFDVTGDPSQGWIQFAGDTTNVKSIGAGMTSGTVSVEGHAGPHAGAGMTGGHLIVDGGTGDWLGAEMGGGFIEVRGDAGNQVGAAYRGSRKGMTGGVILCRGAAGGEAGLLMRGGLIVVEQGCGEFAGASMIAGSIFVFGKTGDRLGAGMKRGTIFAGGVDELPPSFRYSCEYRPTFLPLYLRPLKAVMAAVPDPSVGGPVSCYRGDLLHGGRGEILIGRGS
ncbi:MAG: formylmethanofuran dehydrogenase subunit [Gemmataceae bacterium]|nr:formylmethanofuran dehydrogenase subunit [Gemmataceae bacterium]